MYFYTWHGEPVTDYKRFCREHDSQMVKHERIEKYLTRDGWQETVYVDEMPAIFYDNLRYGENTYYRELERYDVGE